jgi:hypothetical protein
VNFFFENLSLVPETRAPKEHFKLLFGSGTSSPAKIRPLKVGPPAINWKSSLYENFHPFVFCTKLHRRLVWCCARTTTRHCEREITRELRDAPLC